MLSLHMHALTCFSAFFHANKTASPRVNASLSLWLLKSKQICQFVSTKNNRKGNITLTIHHCFLCLFLQRLHPVLPCSQITSLPSQTKTDHDHQKAAVNQAMHNLLASPRKRFSPLQECWNCSISELSKQGRQQGEDNELPFKKNFQYVIDSSCNTILFKELQRMDCGWWPSVLSFDVKLCTFHRTR